GCSSPTGGFTEENAMWEYDEQPARVLSHDLPCLECGHAAHRFLPCDAACECASSPVPGWYDA
ncbi:MAG: hypothetical protein KDB28_11405, partial [Tetrasphaera sp.]|nr:hypothetical protein [Tetrasphaera sp.]